MNSAQEADPPYGSPNLFNIRAIFNRIKFTGVKALKITYECVPNKTEMKWHIVSIIHTLGVCLNSAWLYKVIQCRSEKLKATGRVNLLDYHSSLSTCVFNEKGVS